MRRSMNSGQGASPFRRLAISGAVVTCVIVAGLFGTAGSAAAAGSGYYVTFVARSCSSYSDIFANKARNDIQESLKDLGPDSPYNGTDQLVNPAVESQSPQDRCRPLPDWTFTLGHGYESRAVTGPWGSLSKVTDPFPRKPLTEESTQLYDQFHQPVEGQQLEGANDGRADS